MKKWILLIFACVFATYTPAQNFTNSKPIYFPDTTQKLVTFKFKLINNLVVIPVKINNSDTLFFILDSGIKPTLITDLGADQTLPLKYARETAIRGLGHGADLKVIQSVNNTIEISDAVGHAINLLVLPFDRFELSKQMGMRINGIIGADVFSSFIVMINYTKLEVTFFNPKYFKYRRYHNNWIKYPIIIYKDKPYITLPVQLNDTSQIMATLLIDSGSSDALWLFTRTHPLLDSLPSGNPVFIGQGLNGSIFGVQNYITALHVGKKILKQPLVSFPDSFSIRNSVSDDILGRNGSIGGEILSRFDVIFDYQNKFILLKPNHRFPDKFYRNLSGLNIVAPLIYLPVFEISSVSENSPAYNAGIRKGDFIVAINGVKCTNYTLNDIVHLLSAKPGKKIRMKLLRNGQPYKTYFYLQNP